MWAVLSDIHGNLEALSAVLADIARHPVSHVFCLGDLVGYGPNPVECIEKAMDWDVVVLGDHDRDAMFDEIGFSYDAAAYRMAEWVRKQINGARRDLLWEFLAGRLRSHKLGDFVFVHGSPRNPLSELIFPEDVYNTRKMTRNAEVLERYCFCGHTHVPGVFVEPETEGENWQFRSPEELPGFYRLDGRKTIVNVGSVGQPRDGNWRACYALVEGWDITFRRVEYDVDATVAKIYAIPELDNFLGDRLREGR
jgi:diadenosine tetraphosphatase ApaH/serine/threonine PP2A family protein phosphatase